MRCPSCQAVAPPGSRFCPQCGTALPSDNAAARSTRRQMTVLFCDVVGSTELAQRVDPDELLDALRRYHDMVSTVAARFGGFTARIVGDGVDLYFGYPVANEDDAVRALHTALALASEVRGIAVAGQPLSLRIGLATGLVAVSSSQGIAVAGTTPNLAARIQAAVPPGSIGVAPGTRRIGGAPFEFEDFGEHQLKGVDTPVAISLLRGARSMNSRSAWRGRDASLPMVGREPELAALQAHWQRAAAGQTCCALVVGEAGLGKSRLLTALDQALPPQGHTLLRLQCSPFHVNSALQPFVQHLAAAAGLGSGDSPSEQLDKLEAQLAIAGIGDSRECALLAALLGVPFDGRYPPLAMPPPMQLQLTKEALKHYFSGLTHQRLATANQETLKRYFAGLSEQRPLLISFEDLHWIDPTSLEVVELMISSSDSAPILLLMSARPDFQPPWQASAQFIWLTLQRLSDAEAKAVALQQSRQAPPGIAQAPPQNAAQGMRQRVLQGRPQDTPPNVAQDAATNASQGTAQPADLPAGLLDAIVERTDGVPLFIEEMTRMWLETRDAMNPGGSLARAVPDTLMDLLTARLDRLPLPGKLTAQLASVIGREFDRELLLATAPDSTEELHAGLQALLDSGLVLSSSADGAHLVFKHALVEDTAYSSLPPKRRAELHGQVAEALLQHFKERVERQPELAARHLTAAGHGLRAAPWWQAAGGQALSRGAPREAAADLRAGVEALTGVAAGPERDAAELGLLSMLGPTTMVLLGPGSAEFGAVQQRAHGLSQALPGQPRLFPTTYGWCLFNWGRARLNTARQLVDRLLQAAAERSGDTEAAMAANNMAGMVRLHLGEPEAARMHLSQSTALYEPQRDAALYPVYLMDFGVFGRFYLALATQVLGFPDAARRIAAEALLLADQLKQPHTLGFAMLANFNTALMRGDVEEALPMAERCIAFSSQFGFPEFIAMGGIARGWALAHGQQRWQEGLAEVQAGISGWARTGFENWQPWFTALEAEILGHLGRQDEALQRIDEQLARIAANGERLFESPLLAERAAALSVQPGGSEQAQAVFDQALALARSQGAAAWVERVQQRRPRTHS